MNLVDHPHKRRNSLTGEWILVSPHRAKRPWQGKVEDAQKSDMPQYDPKCYLCPGNERAGGIVNPVYSGAYVFDNDFAALLADSPHETMAECNGLFAAAGEKGLCRVVCFSPRHDLTLALMAHEDVKSVVDVWTSQFRELSQVEYLAYIQIFENRGAVMGCSNPHPHGQIWANETVPQIPFVESENQSAYFVKYSRPMLLDYVEDEMRRGKRVVFANDSFAAVVPFWAVWPFETMILPRFSAQSLLDFNDKQRGDFAEALSRMAVRFDNLFKTSFPYSMGIHQAPVDNNAHPEWQLHVHYYPPLLRSATVKKFMVGYEMLGTPQRDITAEESARRLRDECSEVHYLRT